MLFHRSRSAWRGKDDIFAVRRQGDGWDQIHLGAGVNSPNTSMDRKSQPTAARSISPRIAANMPGIMAVNLAEAMAGTTPAAP